MKLFFYLSGLGLVDLDQFIESLLAGLSANPNREPYCQFQSKMFQNKVFKFILMKNAFGQYLDICEVYEGGLQEGMRANIHVSGDDGKIMNMVEKLEEVRDHAKNLWTSIHRP